MKCTVLSSIFILGLLAMGEGLQQSDIAEVMNKDVLPSVRFCYQRSISDNPAFEASTLAVFEVTPKGKVKNLKFRPKFPNQAMMNCLTSAFNDAVFPEHSGAMPKPVSYPIHFQITKK